MTKTLPTNTTKMRLLSAVDSQVFFQSRSLAHGLPADEARPLPLPAVGALDVPLQVAGVVELAAADVTRERAQVELLLML